MGRVQLYTGNGEGKTTTALGLALRAVGHRKKVIIIQFMKGRKNIGEFRAAKLLKPYYEIYQFGRKDFIETDKPTKKDRKLAEAGFEFAKKEMKRKPTLLILDEINLAAAIGLVKTEDVIELLKHVPKLTHVILTGIGAPKKLIRRADLVTIMKKVKHPYSKGELAKKGIEF